MNQKKQAGENQEWNSLSLNRKWVPVEFKLSIQETVSKKSNRISNQRISGQHETGRNKPMKSKTRRETEC